MPQINFTAGYQRTTGNLVGQPGVTSTANGSTTAATGTTKALPPPTWATGDYWSGSVTASLLLFDGLQTPHNWLSARANARGQEQTWREQRIVVATNVRTAFYNAIANKSLVKVAQESLDNNISHMKQTEGFVQAGTQPEISLATAEDDCRQCQGGLDSSAEQLRRGASKVTLNNAIGIERDTNSTKS